MTKKASFDKREVHNNDKHLDQEVMRITFRKIAGVASSRFCRRL
jgi:hypothetical protein